MAKLVSCAFAQSRSIDMTTGNISLFNLVDRITIARAEGAEVLKEPTQFPIQTVFFSRWMKDGVEAEKQKVEIELPDGIHSDSIESEINYNNGQFAVNLIESPMLPVSTEGTYYAVLYLSENDDWVEKMRCPFTVAFQVQKIGKSP